MPVRLYSIDSKGDIIPPRYKTMAGLLLCLFEVGNYFQELHFGLEFIGVRYT